MEFGALIIVANGIIINDITCKRIAVKRSCFMYHINISITNIGDIKFNSSISKSLILKPNYYYIHLLILN